MSRENPLWGASRIHGELLMLGIDINESTVGRCVVRTGRRRSQGWKTFLHNHATGIAVIDLFVVRTISLKYLYGLVVLRYARRRLVRTAITSNPRPSGSPDKSLKPSLGPKHRVISFVTVRAPSVRRTSGAFVRWFSGVPYESSETLGF
jgi:hypothetical protein